MPGRDGTGPMGRGEMRGQGLGLCSGDVAGHAAQTGRVFTCGRRFGAGSESRRRAGRFISEDTNGVNEKELLMKEKDLLQKKLETVCMRQEKISEVQK